MEISTSVEGTKATFKVEGKLTVQTAPRLENAIGQVPDDTCDFDIDLANVTYVSSAGLRVIVAADHLATSRGGTLRLLNPADEVMEVFSMTGLSEALAIER